MDDDSEDWISAAAAIALLRPVMSSYEATMAICARAHDGVLRSRAARLIVDEAAIDTKEANDVEVPRLFWWARGHAALEQNWITGDFETWIERREHWRAYGVRFLRSDIMKMVPNVAEQPNVKGSKTHGRTIFIGHGHSAQWRELKDFITERLKLPHDEFNAQSPAGVANVERLSKMLDDAAFAFLVLTAEDEQASGKMRARMNVVHEAGLFQGRLGFRKAIVLLEDGCEGFSNIEGLGHIPFPPGRISGAFEEVRRVLERESIIHNSP